MSQRAPSVFPTVSLRESESSPAPEPLSTKEYLELFEFHIRVMTRGIMNAAHQRGEEIPYDDAQLQAVTRFDGFPENDQLTILRAHKNDLDATDD